MVGTIVHQLTKGASIEEIKEAGLDTYYTDHGVGLEYIQIRIQINNWLNKLKISLLCTSKNLFLSCFALKMYLIKIILSFSEIK